MNFDQAIKIQLKLLYILSGVSKKKIEDILNHNSSFDVFKQLNEYITDLIKLNTLTDEEMDLMFDSNKKEYPDVLMVSPSEFIKECFKNGLGDVEIYNMLMIKPFYMDEDKAGMMMEYFYRCEN